MRISISKCIKVVHVKNAADSGSRGSLVPNTTLHAGPHSTVHGGGAHEDHKQILGCPHEAQELHSLLYTDG